MKLNDPAINALFPGTRSALIGLLYGQVDQAFYLREIAARTGVGVGPVQRELKRLFRTGPPCLLSGRRKLPHPRRNQVDSHQDGRRRRSTDAGDRSARSSRHRGFYFRISRTRRAPQ